MKPTVLLYWKLKNHLVVIDGSMSGEQYRNTRIDGQYKAMKWEPNLEYGHRPTYWEFLKFYGLNHTEYISPFLGEKL